MMMRWEMTKISWKIGLNQSPMTTKKCSQLILQALSPKVKLALFETNSSHFPRIMRSLLVRESKDHILLDIFLNVSHTLFNLFQCNLPSNLIPQSAQQQLPEQPCLVIIWRLHIRIYIRVDA